MENKPQPYRTRLSLPVPIKGAKQIQTYVSTTSKGILYYRVQLPAAAVNHYHRDKFNVSYTNFVDARDISGEFKWEALVSQGQYNQKDLDIALNIREKNKTALIYEIDDDVMHLHDTANPSFIEYSATAARKGTKDFITSSDFVSVSTEPLKKVYSEFNKNITVLPNCVDEEVIKHFVKGPDDYEQRQLVIGWTGSPSHYIDLKPMAKAVVDVVNMYPHVGFLIGGWSECPFFTEIREDKILRVPYTPNIPEYFEILSKIDIGITPLVNNKFNESKSNLKYIEMAALGTPVISSDVYPYASIIKSGQNGILLKSNGSLYKIWKRALCELIEDAKLRKRFGTNGRKLVEEKFTIQKNVGKWVDFYEKATGR